MASVLGQLAENLVNMAKSAIKMRSIPVDDLRELIRGNIKRHKRIFELINTFSQKDYGELYLRYVQIMKQNPKLLSNKVHETYIKHLLGKAKSDEDKFFMNSLAQANKDFIDIMQDIDKNLDFLIKEKTLTISNVRMTSISVLGIIKQSEMLVNFTMYLYGQFTSAFANTVGEIAQYRSKYMVDNVEKVALIVTQVRNKSGAYMFLQEAKQLRGKNADMILNANSSIGFLNLLNMSNYTKGFLDNLGTVLSMLNIFRWTQDKWEDYKYTCYQENKETLSWMENNVALLRMELTNIPQDDPRYQHLLKVISAYEANMADYAKKIKEYEEGE